MTASPTDFPWKVPAFLPFACLPPISLVADEEPIRGYVCAAMWPTMSLETHEYWFDELSVWTEGFSVTVTQRARLQVNALRKALAIVQQEKAGTVCVTLSFGTIERHVDIVTSIFDQHMLTGTASSCRCAGNWNARARRIACTAFSNSCAAKA